MGQVIKLPKNTNKTVCTEHCSVLEFKQTIPMKKRRVAELYEVVNHVSNCFGPDSKEAWEVWNQIDALETELEDVS